MKIPAYSHHFYLSSSYNRASWDIADMIWTKLEKNQTLEGSTVTSAYAMGK